MDIKKIKFRYYNEIWDLDKVRTKLACNSLSFRRRNRVWYGDILNKLHTISLEASISKPEMQGIQYYNVLDICTDFEISRESVKIILPNYIIFLLTIHPLDVFIHTHYYTVKKILLSKNMMYINASALI